MAALARPSRLGLPQMSTWARAAVVAGLCLGGAGPAGAQGARQTPEERAAICGEAAERLKDVLAAHPAPAGAVVIATWKETFCPPEVTVKRGERLHVVNVEKRTSHSIWFKADGLAESQRFFPDESVDVTADLAPGDHDYVCGPHPYMTGRVRVEGGAP